MFLKNKTKTIFKLYPKTDTVCINLYRIQELENRETYVQRMDWSSRSERKRKRKHGQSGKKLT